jgi:hypothetical protein
MLVTETIWVDDEKGPVSGNVMVGAGGSLPMIMADPEGNA